MTLDVTDFTLDTDKPKLVQVTAVPGQVADREVLS